MHSDCYVPPDRPRAVPLWHLSLLCTDCACGCTPKGNWYCILEPFVKFAILVGTVQAGYWVGVLLGVL